VRYVMSSTWWPERFTICDDAGRARFEVRNNPGFATKLSFHAIGGEEIAMVRRRRGGRFQVVVRGTDAGLVRQRATDRYDNHSPVRAAGHGRECGGRPVCNHQRRHGEGHCVTPARWRCTGDAEYRREATTERNRNRRFPEGPWNPLEKGHNPRDANVRPDWASQ
jgi:hypothetical protein